MSRQYFTGTLTDAGIWTPQAAVSPGTSETAILAVNQVNKFLPLPYGQNAPSPGQLFKFVVSGLVTTPASGTLILKAYHGTAITGTLIATSNTITPTASITAGYFRIEGDLLYRTISEVATTSTCWCAGHVHLCGPSGGALATVDGIFSSNAAVSVDTTGGTANSFGAVTISVTYSVTGSTWTPEIAYMYPLN